MTQIVECVPNFGEGRDRATIDAIAAAISSVAEVTLLDVDPGAATNRTVMTFVGPPQPVAEAAFLAIAKAAELIDMRRHHGAHARQGATDVCPFVPVANISVDECVVLAKALGERVGRELNLPVYLYAQAAQKAERKKLTDIRVGEYEALEEKLRQPKWAPDYGPATFNARAGATVIGVRPFLIAYNINLNTRDPAIAKEIGLTIREKGRAQRDAHGKRVRDAQGKLVRTPGFPECAATGWFIEEYGRAQVTMNLTDYHTTPIHTAFDRVCELATALGARVTGSEVVGLIPKEPLLMAGRHYLQKQGATTGVSERELIDIAALSLGLGEVQAFDPESKVIDYRVAADRPLVRKSVEHFVDELASSAPAPGGGSVAALGGALAGALVAMVGSLTYGKKGYTDHNAEMAGLGERAHALKDRLLSLVDEDTAAFNNVMAAFRLPKGTDEERAARSAAILEANKEATRVPLRALEACADVADLIPTVIEKGNQNSLSDSGVAALMARAGAWGAFYNVLINLQDIGDETFAKKMRDDAEKILKRADRTCEDVKQKVVLRLRS